MHPLKPGSSAACRHGHGCRWRAGAALALALTCSMGAAHAACTVNGGGTSGNGNYYQPYSGARFQIRVSAGRTTFALPAYPAAGEILFTAEKLLPDLGADSSRGQAAPLYDCPPGVVERFDGAGARIPGYSNLYDSGVQGIGYRVYYYYKNDSNYEVAPVSFTNQYQHGVLVFPFNGERLGSDLKARIEFVATGDPISPGQLLPGNIFGQVTLAGPGGIPGVQLYKVSLEAPVTVTPPTCGIENMGALTVKMPVVPAQLLMRGEGRAIISTTLDLSCSSPSQLSPTVTVTPQSPVSGFAATLGNQESGPLAATGVGIQMWLYEPAAGTFRNPTFGVAEPGVGYPVDSLPSSRWKFRVGGSYMPISSVVTAGKISASATLKFTYP